MGFGGGLYLSVEGGRIARFSVASARAVWLSPYDPPLTGLDEATSQRRLSESTIPPCGDGPYGTRHKKDCTASGQCTLTKKDEPSNKYPNCQTSQLTCYDPHLIIAKGCELPDGVPGTYQYSWNGQTGSDTDSPAFPLGIYMDGITCEENWVTQQHGKGRSSVRRRRRPRSSKAKKTRFPTRRAGERATRIPVGEYEPRVTWVVGYSWEW